MDENLPIMNQKRFRELGRTPLANLDASLSYGPFATLYERLLLELKAKGLNFIPTIWVATEWSCPVGSRGFGIPFYILNPKLSSIERATMGSCEANAKSMIMKLLRHECGHAIDNAFRLRGNPERVKLFGKASDPYPTSYFPCSDPNSFVRHLPDYYAQAHPDEDWAETFAVWLDPKSNWRKKYSPYPKALEKLEFVQRIMSKIKNQKPKWGVTGPIDDISKSNETLDSYYSEKLRCFRINTRKNFFAYMAPIFSTDHGVSAAQYLRRNRQIIAKKIAYKTSLRPYVVERLVEELIADCRLQNHRISDSDGVKLERISKSLLIRARAFQRQKRHYIVM